MNRILILTVAALALAACGPKPVASTPVVQVDLLQTRDYTFAVGPTRTDVEVKAGHLGTTFCFTDSQPNSSEVCNNLTTGKRVVETGSTYTAQFTALEDGHTVNAK
ncbi:hypothetical protein MF271_19280 (plasmid) [Deinococcus sp. KNUC1210]|uniref:lipoprotein n=1 Tax=Deinococcus sp. KNUC1210 TaxID=2917691 RepID=UPI001EF12712|nr:hypothetical protein [Deinococcus sp. KNUC1210]ULH17334.1 hypothetical protein MF271_19280 [Deinococcus sp. KNUC1210]